MLTQGYADLVGSLVLGLLRLLGSCVHRLRRCVVPARRAAGPVLWKFTTWNAQQVGSSAHQLIARRQGVTSSLGW